MKDTMKKLSEILKTFFGYGIVFCLFAGGSTFFGYLLAIIIGGDTAAMICEVLYKRIIPVIIYISTSMVLLGLMQMYLGGEKALTPETEKNMEDAGEL